MKRFNGLLQILAILLIVGGLYGFAGYRNAQKNRGEIKLEFVNEQNLFISHETVNKLLIQKLSADTIQLKETINLDNLEQFLRENQMVENAEVYLNISGELGAIITQRTPVLRVTNASGSYYYDKLGLKMPLSENYSARVPITTEKNEEWSDKELVYLANVIRQDAFLRKEIVSVERVGQKSHPQFELNTRWGDQKVLLGDLTHLEKKIAKLKVFYQKMLLDDTLKDYKTINLKFDEQIVCEK